MKFLVTGGCGFIGSAFVRKAIKDKIDVLNIDLLTYAGNQENLNEINDSPHYNFVKADIADIKKIKKIIFEYSPNYIINFAAESHVDRSIESPSAFINTNILGTFSLLEASLCFYKSIKNESQKKGFRFVHISTDEVYGDLEPDDPSFNENSKYNPSSPYSSSKASADMLVKAWNRTYSLPMNIINCSNNYGPYQFPEKFIPKIIMNALQKNNLPVYGDGLQIRDWLYVYDHVDAIRCIIEKGENGQVYMIGGQSERKNIDVLNSICDELDSILPSISDEIKGFRSLIEYVDDRLGHDKRYSVDISKIKKELGWEPKETFESGLKKTINWYMSNNEWLESIYDNKQKK